MATIYPRLFWDEYLDTELQPVWDNCKIVATLNGFARKLISFEGEFLLKNKDFDDLNTVIDNTTNSTRLRCIIYFTEEQYDLSTGFYAYIELNGTFNYTEKKVQLKLTLQEEYNKNILNAIDSDIKYYYNIDTTFLKPFYYSGNEYVGWDIEKILYSRGNFEENAIANNDELPNIAFSAKSDIKRRTSTNKAVLTIKISRLLEILKSMFNCDYHLTGNSYQSGLKYIFKTYNQVYFESSLGLDLTTFKGTDWTINLKSYKIDNESKPHSETLNFEESRNTNAFDDSDLVYHYYTGTEETPENMGYTSGTAANGDIIVNSNYLNTNYLKRWWIFDIDNPTNPASYIQFYEKVFSSEKNDYNDGSQISVGNGETEININDVNTDFAWLLLNKSSTSDEGYFIGHLTDIAGQLNITDSSVIFANFANGQFAPNNLFNTYLSTNRPFKSSNVDTNLQYNEDITHTFTKYLDRKSVEISLPLTIKELLEVKFYEHHKTSFSDKTFFEKIELPLNGDFAKCLMFYHEDEQK